MVVDEALPFSEKQISENCFLRYFESSRADEMVWHQDPEDRKVRIIQGSGWMLQLDEELPLALVQNTWYTIPKFEWHRLFTLPECTDAVFEVHKLK